jgi:hypothetical protein
MGKRALGGKGAFDPGDHYDSFLVQSSVAFGDILDLVGGDTETVPQDFVALVSREAVLRAGVRTKPVGHS